MSDELPCPGLPPANTIDVWRIDLDAGNELPFETLLTHEEQLRAGRFLTERLASRFQVGRAMLRLGLAHYLRVHPKDVVLQSGVHGKPQLAGIARLHFNVSHTGSLALIAFTALRDVGIDVEAIRDNVEGMEIASAYFTPLETAVIASALPEEQSLRFLQLWVRKEAVLKASGRGISDGLDLFEVIEPGRTVHLGEIAGKFGPSSWVVQDLDAPEGFVAAIAAAPGDWRTCDWAFTNERSIERLYDSVMREG
ncbi:4'-phosphopantetheinyl transferase family protein [Acidicapsa dinghuensis]|uniref:4'-phosphopantetheinyl transferase family protein n=1 Tax=Acidicapsa dinghuensis TaxID=2218256 RepID=A0ABW1ECZ6_9BACT|nr:4'-phosphopantetheinyl transferase superfamily protein [Acidicapsa dinghuensis]